MRFCTPFRQPLFPHLELALPTSDDQRRWFEAHLLSPFGRFLLLLLCYSFRLACSADYHGGLRQRHRTPALSSHLQQPRFSRLSLNAASRVYEQRQRETATSKGGLERRHTYTSS